MKVLGFLCCCEELEDALKMNLLVIDPVYEEINLGYHPLPKGTETWNALSGEKYDPNTFSMSMGLSYCPFCGTVIGDKPE